MRKREFLAVFLLLAVAALVACQPQKADIGELTFVVNGNGVEGPEDSAGGWTKLTLDNQAEQVHALTLYKIAEDKSQEDLQALSEEDGPPEWAEYYGELTVGDGGSQSLVTNLAPGKYVLEVTDQGEEGAPGKYATMIVSGSGKEVAGEDLPEADVSIEMRDFAFTTANEIKAGNQMVRYSNTGKELHAMLISRLKEGKTIDDVQAVVQREMNGEEVPEEELPIEAPELAFILSPGVTTYVNRTFEPGNYVIFCPLPSAANDMAPHFGMGMLSPLTVSG